MDAKYGCGRTLTVHYGYDDTLPSSSSSPITSPKLNRLTWPRDTSIHYTISNWKSGMFGVKLVIEVELFLVNPKPWIFHPRPAFSKPLQLCTDDITILCERKRRVRHSLHSPPSWKQGKLVLFFRWAASAYCTHKIILSLVKHKEGDKMKRLFAKDTSGFIAFVFIVVLILLLPDFVSVINKT